MFTYIALLISIISMVTAQLCLKKGMLLVGGIDFSVSGFASLIFKTFTNLYLFGGLAFLGIGFFTWLYTLSKMNLNVVYPISTSLNFVLIITLSWVLFKEVLNPLQVIGIGVILFGIYLLIK